MTQGNPPQVVSRARKFPAPLGKNQRASTHSVGHMWDASSLAAHGPRVIPSQSAKGKPPHIICKTAGCADGRSIMARRPSRQDGADLAKDDAAVKLRRLTRRVEVLVSLAVVAASVVLAVVLHRTLVYCSYLGGQPPPPCSHPTDYPMALRLGIVAAGLIIGGLIVAIGRYAHRRRG